MNINRDDLKSLQSAYRTVLTESQETGYNGGMNNIYKAVLVYTGYNENDVQEVHDIKASGIEEVMDILLQRDRKHNADVFEDNEEEFEGYMDEFFGHGKVVDGVGISECGEENCWVVLPKGHKFYDLVSIDTSKWSEAQWDEWLEFMDKTNSPGQH